MTRKILPFPQKRWLEKDDRCEYEGCKLKAKYVDLTNMKKLCSECYDRGIRERWSLQRRVK